MAPRLLLPLVIVASFAAGCGDDSGESASLEDYCRLSEELSDEALEELATLDPAAPQADFNALFLRVLADHEDDLQRLELVAPDEIRDDVIALNRLIAEAIATGDLSLVESGEGADIDSRVQGYASDNCPSG